MCDTPVSRAYSRSAASISASLSGLLPVTLAGTACTVQERLFWAAAPVLLFIAWMLGINYDGNTTSAPSEAQYYAATVFMAIAVVQVGRPMSSSRVSVRTTCPCNQYCRL